MQRGRGNGLFAGGIDNRGRIGINGFVLGENIEEKREEVEMDHARRVISQGSTGETSAKKREDLRFDHAKGVISAVASKWARNTKHGRDMDKMEHGQGAHATVKNDSRCD